MCSEPHGARQSRRGPGGSLCRHEEGAGHRRPRVWRKGLELPRKFNGRGSWGAETARIEMIFGGHKWPGSATNWPWVRRRRSVPKFVPHPAAGGRWEKG